MHFLVLTLGSTISLADANPRFTSGNVSLDSPLDVAISWRMPQIGKDLKRLARKVYLWPHDILTSPVGKEQVELFDDVLWLSKWQREQWIEVDSSFSRFNKIFGNGVDEKQFKPIEERRNPFSCIYGSNYGRGLSILVNLWPEIKAEFPRATLDVYYGWQHWGALSEQEEKDLRQKMDHLPDIHDHGCVGHEELNRGYETASFWTYPCTKPETFCITALRAQLAGAVPIIIKHSALGETVRNGFYCDRVEHYLPLLRQAFLSAENISLEQRSQMGEFILQEFTWKQIAISCKKLFESLTF